MVSFAKHVITTTKESRTLKRCDTISKNNTLLWQSHNYFSNKNSQNFFIFSRKNWVVATKVAKTFLSCQGKTGWFEQKG